MLAHGVATDPSRNLRCPATSRVSTAPLGLVFSLSFNMGCKEKNKIFINVDRYGKCQNHTFKPLATASFGDMADSSTPIFPRIHVKDPYQRLGISREASEQEIRAARNYLISKYAGHKASVDAIESAHDRIIMQSFFDREKKNPKWTSRKNLGNFVSHVWIFLCFLVPWHLLDGICNSTYTARSCVTYALLFISSTFLK
ncbi:hypothetical protein SETIT_9G465700v2 [Setaria italica]|uniref:Uncharacterized protein n=1 Tax=Setaria italica TaxID=4555 RepID=A0A368ST56_SETIT|nr:hypothetical protein SETIT_9G465700v2 [Setaria italica]